MPRATSVSVASVSIRALLAREQVRFLLVGGVNTLVGYGFYALFLIFAGYLVSLYLSYAVAVSIAFVLHRRFTFRVSGNVVVDFVRFVGVYVISLAVNSAVLPLLVEVAGMHPLAAQAIALLITTLISYVGHKWFSFRRSATPPRPSSPTSHPQVESPQP